MPYIEIRGKRFFYAGDPGKAGVPVVFCHGSGGSHRHWLYQLKGLGGKANPLAVDLPGHGLSGGEPADNIAAYRSWVHDFRNALDLEPFILGGHSMGGAIALDYALQYPEELAGLILVGTGGRLRVAPAILKSFRSGQVPPSMIDFAYGPEADAELLEKGRSEMAVTPASVFLADFTACDRFDVMEQLHRIDLPSLIICGSDDRLTPVKYSRFLKEHLSRGELVELAGAGHMVMLEAFMEANAAISRFVQNLSEA